MYHVYNTADTTFLLSTSHFINPISACLKQVGMGVVMLHFGGPPVVKRAGEIIRRKVLNEGITGEYR